LVYVLGGVVLVVGGGVVTVVVAVVVTVVGTAFSVVVVMVVGTVTVCGAAATVRAFPGLVTTLTRPRTVRVTVRGASCRKTGRTLCPPAARPTAIPTSTQVKHATATAMWRTCLSSHPHTASPAGRDRDDDLVGQRVLVILEAAHVADPDDEREPIVDRRADSSLARRVTPHMRNAVRVQEHGDLVRVGVHDVS
jgi:hypothetical protein